MTIYQNNIAGTGFLTGPTGAPGPAANTYIQEYEYIATQGQTTFTGNDRYNNPMSYVANTIFVVLNGSVLNEVEEYSALDGSTITLNQAAAANDELIVYTFPPFNVANTYTQQQANTIFLKQSGGTISGNLNFANGSNFTVPVGNTAQRPTASPGFIRYNTDLGTLESANATAWANVGSGSASSGSGGVTWQPVQNTNFIAVIGNGYGVNTATGNVTVTLPASPIAGQQINLFDYGQTFSANGLIIYPNGNKLLGNTANITIQSSGASVGLVYYDTIKGWVPYTGFSSSIIGPYLISYLLVAGGGGGAELFAGGGAGGMITGSNLSVTPGTSYVVTVGGGGAGTPAGTSPVNGTSGSNSTAINYTALGGGFGGAQSAGGNGGSGGGGGGWGNVIWAAGTGTPGQGNPGSAGYPDGVGGAGGGAGAPGGTAYATTGGVGGVGLSSSITGSSVYYAGGGGGGAYTGTNTSATGGAGGNGGGGAGGVSSGSQGTGNGTAGGSNTGGGGGGGTRYVQNASGAPGGSGVVIFSYFGQQRAQGGNISTSGGYTIHTFTTSGTFVA